MITKKQVNELIDNFIDVRLFPLREQIKSLGTKARALKGQKKYDDLNLLCIIMQQFETQIVFGLRSLQLGDTFLKEDVTEFFEVTLKRGKEIKANLLEQRSNWEIIKDVIADFANLCIKLLSFGKSSEYFNTTSKFFSKIERGAEVLKAAAEEFNNVEPMDKGAKDFIPAVPTVK